MEKYCRMILKWLLRLPATENCFGDYLNSYSFGVSFKLKREYTQVTEQKTSNRIPYKIVL